MKTILFLLLVVVIFSCKEETNYHYLTDAQKVFARYGKGSYWVYENDSTHIIDSLHSNGGSGDWNWTGYEPDLFMEYGNGLISSIDSLKVFTYSVRANYNDDVNINFKIYSNFYVKAEIEEFYYQTVRKEGFYGSDLIQTIPSLAVAGNTFYNIVSFDKNLNIDSNAIPPYPIHFIVYYRKYLGMVKYKISYSDNSTESWSLKRWRIY